MRVPHTGLHLAAAGLLGVAFEVGRPLPERDSGVQTPHYPKRLFHVNSPTRTAQPDKKAARKRQKKARAITRRHK